MNPLHAPAATAPMNAPVNALILDTNIVLDLLLFQDPQALHLQASLPLNQSLNGPQWQWIATTAMRDELAHVLCYPHLQPRMAFYQTEAAQILQGFDTRVQLVEVAAPTHVRCRDGDDQKFIDLAVAHKATLLSKDKAVLKLRKRLARLDVVVQTHLPPAAAATPAADSVS